MAAEGLFPRVGWIRRLVARVLLRKTDEVKAMHDQALPVALLAEIQHSAATLKTGSYPVKPPPGGQGATMYLQAERAFRPLLGPWTIRTGGCVLAHVRGLERWALSPRGSWIPQEEYAGLPLGERRCMEIGLEQCLRLVSYPGDLEERALAEILRCLGSVAAGCEPCGIVVDQQVRRTRPFTGKEMEVFTLRVRREDRQGGYAGEAGTPLLEHEWERGRDGRSCPVADCLREAIDTLQSGIRDRAARALSLLMGLPGGRCGRLALEAAVRGALGTDERMEEWSMIGHSDHTYSPDRSYRL